MSMTSRERVRAAIELRESDRVPYDFRARPEVIRKLSEHFGVEDREDLLRKLGVDLRDVQPIPVQKDQPGGEPGTTKDMFGVEWKMVEYPTGRYREVARSPLADATNVEEIEDHPWPGLDAFDFSNIKADCEKYAEFAVTCGAMTGVFEGGWYLRGYNQILLDMAMCPDIAHCIFEKYASFHHDYLERILKEADGRIDIVCSSDDLGTQLGLLISPEMFNEYFAARYERTARMIKSYGAKVFMHSCGAIRKLIPRLIDVGVDILNPIQTQAAGMVPEELKAEFGDRLCFQGAIDIQQTLPYGTVDDVKQEVAHRIATLGKGGGYILGPTHLIQSDTPLENILAMYGVK